MALAREDGELALARTRYHGGAGTHDVTSRTRAHTPETDDRADPTDPDQPKRGGVPYGAYLDDIMSRHADLFGPSPEAAGTVVLKPKTPAQRARERRASRPKHTNGVDG